MLIHSKLSQCTAGLSHIMQITTIAMSLLMARKSLTARILLMAEEMDGQELPLVPINKTVVFQRVVKML